MFDNLIAKQEECTKCPVVMDKNNESCYNLCVVCQPKPREAKNLNVCWTVMFIKGKPENKNVYCEREQKIVTENSFHDRLLAGQQVGSVM